MRNSNTGDSPSGQVDAGTVISAFAGMLQVGFVYPANNPRVATVCADLVEVLRAFSPGGDPIDIEVRGDLLCIGEHRFGRDREDVAWTIDRIDRAGLDGIRLEPTLEPGALIELTVALRTCFPPGAPKFAQVWSPDGAGVTPITQETGSPPGRAEAPDAPHSAQPAAGPGAGEPTERPRADTAAAGQDNVLTLLARSAHVRETLATIHSRFEDEFAGKHAFDAAGMLERLVSDLPDAVRADPESACGHIETVLDLVLVQLEVFLLSRPEDPGDRLVEVASTLLQRRLPGPEEPTAAGPIPERPPAPQPDASQERKTPQTAVGLPFAAPMDHSQTARRPAPADSPPAGPAPQEAKAEETEPLPFLAEIEKLPRAEDFDDVRDGSERNDEVFGAGLHLLGFGRDETTVTEGATRLLAPLIANPSAVQRRILSAYLHLVRDGEIGDGKATARTRLEDFFQSHGRQHLASPQSKFDFGRLVETFPELFVEFLDALDAGSECEQAFSELIEAVGERAVDEATHALIQDESLLSPKRAEKLLGIGGPRGARIAARLARIGAGWTREQVVNYLRRQELSRSDGAALAIIRPLDGLPTAYLADLCSRVARGNAESNPHEYSSLLLRQFVRDTADKPGDLDRRLYAIRALGHWPSPETVQYLEQLAKEGRFRLQSKDGRAIRQAATDALAQIRATEEHRT